MHLHAGELAQLLEGVREVSQHHLEAGVDADAKAGKLGDAVAKDEEGHHAVAHKHGARHERKVQQVGQRQA